MEKNVYSRAKISVRFLDGLIIIGLGVLAAVMIFLSINGGFDINFDSCGGSDVASRRLRYGEAIAEPEAPIREGYSFVGWYADRALVERVDFSSATVTQSVTFYAAWEEMPPDSEGK